MTALAAAATLEVMYIRRRDHGWGLGTIYARRFNPDDLVQLTGRLSAITRFQPRPGMSEGIQLVLDCEHGLIPVHLGPTNWLHHYADSLQPGDEIQVTGSRVLDDIGSYLIATTVRKGNEVRSLRSARGKPLWRQSPANTEPPAHT